MTDRPIHRDNTLTAWNDFHVFWESFDVVPNRLRVAQIGNFGPEHSTENHLHRALLNNGHLATKAQENVRGAFDLASRQLDGLDLILWTRTGWDWPFIYGPGGDTIALQAQALMLARAKIAGVPIVAFHLDRWWDLNREHQLDEPFFQCDIVITADGGNQERFAAKGINHVWFPPGVSRDECEPGMFRDEFHSKLAFVGSWQGGYHQEHQHRFELVAWLRKNFRRDCAFWPKEGRPAVRGQDLRDLYASVDVVVGDSCFAGSTKGAYYWSDRIPETIGRGGYLLHPWVEGLQGQFTTACHMGTWTAGDWDGLGNAIEWALTHPDDRRAVARQGREHVLQHHTYEVRVQQLVDLLNERNLLR